MRRQVEAIWRGEEVASSDPVIEAHRALVDGTPLDAPRRDEPAPNILLARAHGLGAVGRLDVDGLRGVLAAIDLIPCDDVDALDREVLRAWEGVLTVGRYPELDALATRARVEQHAAIGVEAVALRAFVQGLAGDAAAALKDARRCSMMASSEGLLPSRVIAGWALARARRFDGEPYLAAQIGSSAMRLNGSSFRELIGWECAMAGADTSGALGRKVRHLVDHPDEPTAWKALEARLVSFGPYLDELSALRAALGAPLEAREDVRRWCRGERVPLTPAHRGVMGGAPTTPFAWIVAGPQGTRRQLQLRDAGDTAPRTRHGLATLALAGPEGLDEADFFASIYGFAFEAAVHGALYRKLVSRMRRALDGLAAEITREDGSVRMRCAGEVWLADPDCIPTAAHRVQWALASAPGSTLKQVAEACGLPVRTVQRVAGEMVDAGCLSSRRLKSHVVYRVEDSVWTSVTASPLSASR